MKHLISFEQDRIVYVKGKKSGKFLAVASVSTAAVPGAIANGRIREREALTEALKELVKTCRLGGKKVTVVLSDLAAATRELSLPEAQSEKELRELVTNEMLYRHSGMGSDYVIDYMSLPQKEEASGLNLLAMAIQKDSLEEYLEVLREAGLRCGVMDITSNCIGKLVRLCYPELQGVIATYIFHNHIALMLIEGDMCIFSRTVALNVDEFEQSGSMDFLAEEISGHLDKVRSFQATRRGARPLQKILLMGTKPQLELLLPLIAKDQDLPCEIFAAPNGIKAPEDVSFSDYAKPLGAIIRRE